MPISAEFPGHNGLKTLFLRIPTSLDELTAHRTFVQPLKETLSVRASKMVLRSFVLPTTFGQQPGIGIEIQSTEIDIISIVIERIAALGAPPDTVVEIETDQGTVEGLLAEFIGG